MRLVHVSWVDSNGGGGWKDLKAAVRDADENTLGCESVGWLIAETDAYLLVAPTLTTSTDKQVSDALQIPRCAVTAVRSLTVGRKHR